MEENPGKGRDISDWVRDILTVISIMVALLSVAATSMLAYKQLQINRDAAALNYRSQLLQSEERDRSFLTGLSIRIDHDSVVITNNNPQTVLAAGYWIVGERTDEEGYSVLVERYSQLAPLVACTRLTFPTSKLATPDTTFKSASLAFKVPSGRWWGISSDNLLELSEYRGDDPTRALTGLRSNQLMDDTVVEGFDKNDQSDIDDGTGPVVSSDTSLVSNHFGIDATSSLTNCRSG
ncbi:hypothetical protein [Mycobacteroides abscessus]|uniref:hypothetical protein n=1 Tax=Mycobacteroides abscessus TaxID=36809 RepID=UPI000D82871A|nr:hypothetical protein [Mycobacteroides abscessus]SPX82459.1 Uncharacterised protein [Mycobacteroides abscessus]